MAEKHLTELSWKNVAGKTVKDTTLQKALAKYGACADDDYDGRLKALTEIGTCATTVKKNNGAQGEVVAYLTDVNAEVAKARKSVETLKQGADKRKVQDEAQETGTDLKSNLLNGMRKAKSRAPEDPPVEVLVCKAGKQWAALLAKTVGATQKNQLLEVLKGETGHKFYKGTCELKGADVYTFTLDTLPSGAAKGVKAFIKDQTGVNYKLRVCDSSGAAEEDVEATPQQATPQSTVDLMPAFKKRMEALLPKLKAALASGDPKAQEDRLQVSQAGVLATKKEFDKANAMLDPIEKRLNPPALTKAPHVREPVAVRSELKNVDAASADMPALLTKTSDMLQDMKATLISQGKVKVVQDQDHLAVAFASENNTDKDTALKRIIENKARGFTGKSGTIYILGGGSASDHDTVHETVHVMSADGGQTKIMSEFGEQFNEGFTEYFTEIFCAQQKVPYADAYVGPRNFLRRISKVVNHGIIYAAYIQDGGIDPVLDALAKRWEQNTAAKSAKITANKDHGKNIDNLRNKLKGFASEDNLWLGFWDKIGINA